MNPHLDDESDDEHPCCPEEIAKSNKLMLKNLAFCLIAFYAIYFSMSALMHGILNLEKAFNGQEPFNFVTMSTLHVSTSSTSIASFLSMELTYFFTTFVISFYLLCRVWDYAITITFVHIILTCAVMGQFPTIWQWWCALAIGLIWMIIMGESMSFFLRRRNERHAIGQSLNFPMSQREKQKDSVVEELSQTTDIE